MSGLYWQTITPGIRKLMGTFSLSRIGKEFYLAGGTALALQLGHRRSGDLNFYSPSADIHSLEDTLLRALEANGPLMSDSGWGNLIFLVGGVRIGFYGYENILVQPLVEVEGIRLASVSDIALMKMESLLERGERMDFLDLYAILQVLPLANILSYARMKFPGTGDFEARVIKRLIYFERADEDMSPPLLKPVDWETVKKFFRKLAVEFNGVY
jgi:hypothetical protein